MRSSLVTTRSPKSPYSLTNKFAVGGETLLFGVGLDMATAIQDVASCCFWIVMMHVMTAPLLALSVKVLPYFLPGLRPLLIVLNEWLLDDSVLRRR